MSDVIVLATGKIEPNNLPDDSRYARLPAVLHETAALRPYARIDTNQSPCGDFLPGQNNSDF